MIVLITIATANCFFTILLYAVGGFIDHVIADVELSVDDMSHLSGNYVDGGIFQRRIPIIILNLSIDGFAVERELHISVLRAFKSFKSRALDEEVDSNVAFEGEGLTYEELCGNDCVVNYHIAFGNSE